MTIPPSSLTLAITLGIFYFAGYLVAKYEKKSDKENEKWWSMEILKDIEKFRKSYVRSNNKKETAFTFNLKRKLKELRKEAEE